MSEKRLEISVYDRNSLLIKDYTLKERWERQSNEKVLSENIYLPGYENKPIKIGVSGDVSINEPSIFIDNSDFKADDVVIHFAWSKLSKSYSEC